MYPPEPLSEAGYALRRHGDSLECNSWYSDYCTIEELLYTYLIEVAEEVIWSPFVEAEIFDIQERIEDRLEEVWRSHYWLHRDDADCYDHSPIRDVRIEFVTIIAEFQNRVPRQA